MRSPFADQSGVQQSATLTAFARSVANSIRAMDQPVLKPLETPTKAEPSGDHVGC